MAASPPGVISSVLHHPRAICALEKSAETARDYKVCPKKSDRDRHCFWLNGEPNTPGMTTAASVRDWDKKALIIGVLCDNRGSDGLGVACNKLVSGAKGKLTNGNRRAVHEKHPGWCHCCLMAEAGPASSAASAKLATASSTSKGNFPATPAANTGHMGMRSPTSNPSTSPATPRSQDQTGPAVEERPEKRPRMQQPDSDSDDSGFGDQRWLIISPRPSVLKEQLKDPDDAAWVVQKLKDLEELLKRNGGVKEEDTVHVIPLEAQQKPNQMLELTISWAFPETLEDRSSRTKINAIVKFLAETIGDRWVEWDAYRGSLVLVVSSSAEACAKLMIAAHAPGGLALDGHAVVSVHRVHCVHMTGSRAAIQQMVVGLKIAAGSVDIDVPRLLCGDRGVEGSANPLDALNFWQAPPLATDQPPVMSMFDESYDPARHSTSEYPLMGGNSETGAVGDQSLRKGSPDAHILFFLQCPF